jgi:hypothetical protein
MNFYSFSDTQSPLGVNSQSVFFLQTCLMSFIKTTERENFDPGGIYPIFPTAKILKVFFFLQTCLMSFIKTTERENFDPGGIYPIF